MRFFLIFVIIFSASLSAFSAEKACMSKKERASAQIRIMQTHMMVAALSCQQQGSYNRFVRQFKPVLQDSSSNLRQYFSRVYGVGAEKNLNSFVTKISNIESSSSLKNGEENYCKNAAEKFRLVLEMRPADLSNYAQKNFRQNLPEENLCASEMQSALR